MAIDKVEDYFLYNYKDGVKERPNGMSLEALIKVVRIRSSNNQPEVQGGLDLILFLTKKDKKSVGIYTRGIILLDDNDNIVGPDQVKKIKTTTSTYTPLTYDKSKKEVVELLTNKDLQNKQIQSYIDYLNRYPLKGWSVIQDPWDPNTTPPENIPPTTTTTTTLNATTTGTTTTPPKVKLNIVGIPDGLTVKAKEDLSDFTIYVGDIPKEKVDNFENVDELDEEYSEEKFIGQEEGPEDLPIGDIYAELTVDTNKTNNNSTTSTEITKSTPGSGPAPGSKLLYKSEYKGNTLYFLFNPGNGLAGHRLKNIITDLQNYLNSNGFTGAKLGNNGVMRDLVASTYPNSSARAVASLHGAGLAIDLTFSIPGKTWKGIGDNENLSKDTKLTQTIAKWVAGQKDITWGAEWGKSKPNEGMVRDRGIIEYHHFEIKSSFIADYWKPFESELKSMGFDYQKLNTTGKDGQIFKLNKVLLNSVGIT